MITDNDLKKLSKVFATKKDLEELAAKQDLKLEIYKLELKEEIDKRPTRSDFEELKDGVYTRLDKVIGELKTFIEEQAAHSLRHDDIDKDLEAIKTIPAIANRNSCFKVA